MTQKKEQKEGKVTASYYLDQSSEKKLIDIYINRLRQKPRPRRSAIVQEALELLFKLDAEEGMRGEFHIEDRGTVRTKHTFSLDQHVEDMCLAFYIKLLKSNAHAKRGEVIDEALDLLYKQEFGK